MNIMMYIGYQDISLNQVKMQTSEITDLQFLPWTAVRDRIAENDPEFAPDDQEYKLLFSLSPPTLPNANPVEDINARIALSIAVGIKCTVTM